MKKTIGKISDVCKVFAGQSPKGTSYNENCLGMEFHQGKKAFGDFFLGKSNVWTTEITTTAEPGDILMSVRAPVGPTNITQRKICIGRGLAAIRCREKVIPSFVLYALKNIENKIEGNNGAVFNSINKKMIEKLPIPIIGKDEQQRIVSYLDSAFAKIDAVAKNAENSLNEAKALFQSALTKMMEPKEGWEEKKLGEVANINHGKNQKGVIDIHGKYPIYGSGGNIMGYANSYLCDAGTTILGRKGTINNPVFIETKFWNVDTAFGITAKEGTDKKFIFYFVKSQDWSKKDTGTTLPSLTQKIVKETIIPVPSLSEQKRIASYLDSLKSKVDQLQSNLTRTLAECAALKQAILRQTFE